MRSAEAAEWLALYDREKNQLAETDAELEQALAATAEERLRARVRVAAGQPGSVAELAARPKTPLTRGYRIPLDRKPRWDGDPPVDSNLAIISRGFRPGPRRVLSPPHREIAQGAVLGACRVRRSDAVAVDHRHLDGRSPHHSQVADAAPCAQRPAPVRRCGGA
eukprot:SAG11_NODE_6185_length_1369_cov_1.048031_1_plen_163_part_10